LNLGANRIGDRGAADLGFALLLQRSLKELSLFANRITDVGARKLADALGFNIALTVCELGDPVDGSSAIGADGAAAIEEALKVHLISVFTFITIQYFKCFWFRLILD
jgi:hypothetical protein